MLVGLCCNGCYNISYESTYNNTNELIITLNKNGDSSDFIYPALGKTDSTTVKGYYFLPTIEITSYTIVTLKRSKKEVLTDLMVSSTELWPLLVICLLLALIAGFLIWILVRIHSGDILEIYEEICTEDILLDPGRSNQLSYKTLYIFLSLRFISKYKLNFIFNKTQKLNILGD